MTYDVDETIGDEILTYRNDRILVDIQHGHEYSKF
jgi:hypothetical protein